jgi:anti-anti-sigma factor
MLETEILKIEGEIYVLVLAGRLTLGSRLSLLEAQIGELADHGVRKIILDLEKIEYADSAALGVLLHATAALRSAGGTLFLAAPAERLRDLFVLTNTTPLLNLCPTRAESISQLLESKNPV